MYLCGFVWKLAEVLLFQANNKSNASFNFSAELQRISKIDVNILGIARPVLGPDSGKVPWLR